VDLYPQRGNQRLRMSALGVGAVNVVVSVGIILVNKQLVAVCGFNFILTTLALNFATTGSCCEILARCKVFQVKHLPPRDRWLIALMAVCTVLLNNATVEANSVGFYQITKLLIIPTVIMIERLRGIRKTYSRRIILSLIIASIGVAIATVSDFEINVRGTVLASLSILVTAQYQLWQGSKQHEHGVSAMQITHSVTWPQMLISSGATMIFDVLFPTLKKGMLLPSHGLLDYKSKSNATLWLVACCCVAVVMNISTYAFLGRTSPVTYQVVGQFKTCLIITLGYVIFDAKVPYSWLMVRFAGVLIAIVGMLAYAITKHEEQKRKD